MGTKQDILEAQEHIKSLAAKLGWTQNKLAEILYTELNEWDDADEIERFKERLKKELQRPTTKIERLRVYLEVIVRHPDAKKLDVIFNKYIAIHAISPSLSKAVGEISHEIDEAYDKALLRENR